MHLTVSSCPIFSPIASHASFEHREVCQQQQDLWLWIQQTMVETCLVCDGANVTDCLQLDDL
jgi:hypothetical protein